jgi:CheY-like chemotaxis protein
VKGEGGRREAEQGNEDVAPDQQSAIPRVPVPPSRSPLSILLLGHTDRSEFRSARSSMDRWGAVHAIAEMAAASAALAQGQIVPDVIVVAQAFPGQFSGQAIDRLRRLAPLARVVGLMGSWCEGELRSGMPWPAAVRTYWHQWAARCNRQLDRLANGNGCSWALPPTATEEEKLLADVANPWPPRQGLVLICTRRREMADWLAAACRSRGFATACQPTAATAQVQGAVAAIFDAAGLNEACCRDLRRLAAALHPAPVIALLAFPRVEDHRRALSAGAAAVLSKPLVVDDLFWELERVESTKNRGQ